MARRPWQGISRRIGAMALVALLALLLAQHLLAAAAEPGPAITVQALMADKALLQIGSAPARLLRVGESEQGIKLLAANASTATVLINGQKQTLRLSIGEGLQPSVVSSAVIRPYLPPEAAPAAPNGQLVIAADGSGHYHIAGEANGKPVAFVVDTGASLVALTLAQAKSLGYTPDDGRPVRSATANGTALAYHIVLRSLRLGSLRFANVDALIAPGYEGPEALLGMNVLRQVQFRQAGGLLTLTALPPAKKPQLADGSERQ